MMSLAPIGLQPFPDKSGFLDLREFLVNGWASAGAFTFAAQPEGNKFTLMLRVRGDQATGRYIAEGLPFAPPYVVRFQAYYEGESVWLAMNGQGGLTTSFGSAPFPGEISAIITMPRRAP